MSSAAKLRKLGRGTATIATAALVMTSFGPAALAWETPGPEAASAKTGSVGLVDTERTTAGTQGATAVVAGQNGQDGGDIVLVVPATYSAGDYIDVKLATNSDPAKRITWAAVPTLKTDGPYKTATVVSPTGGTTVTQHNAAQGQAESFTAGSGETVPSTPSITPTIVGGGFGDVTVRLTFNTTADASQYNAKFALTLGNVKFNVGEDATGGTHGEVVVTSTAHDNGGAVKNDFFRALVPGNPLPPPGTPDTHPEKNETIPAVITKSSITSATASLAKETSAQALGDVTVRATTGTFGSGPLTITSTGATFTADKVTATFFDGSGSKIGSSKDATPVGATVTFIDGDVPDHAVRAVLSGTTLTPGGGATKVDLKITALGSITPFSGTLTSGDVNQRDIEAPGDVATVTIPLVDNAARIAGSNRYETAVKIAKKLAEANGGDQVGSTDVYEADNVVIASGANFPDALSATYLSHVKKAPVLLVQQDDAPQVVRDFLYDHGVKRVFIVGGEGAVSGGVANGIAGRNATDVDSGELKTTDSKIQVTRLAGNSRFDTNRIVNTYAASSASVGTTVPAYGKASAKTAIIANGFTPWDALAAGAMVRGTDSSQNSGLPVILTDGSSRFHSAAVDELSGLDIKHLIFVGGPGVLPTSLETQAQGAGAATTRIGGDHRWQTAEHIGNFLVKNATASSTNKNPGFGYMGTTPYLSNGGVDADGRPDSGKWADALAAGPLVAKQANVFALTAAAMLPPDTKDLLTSNKGNPFTGIVPVGGTNSVSDSVVNAARAAVN